MTRREGATWTGMNTPGGTRTPNARLRTPPFCPFELQGPHCYYNTFSTLCLFCQGERTQHAGPVAQSRRDEVRCQRVQKGGDRQVAVE